MRGIAQPNTDGASSGINAGRGHVGASLYNSPMAIILPQNMFHHQQVHSLKANTHTMRSKSGEKLNDSKANTNMVNAKYQFFQQPNNHTLTKLNESGGGTSEGANHAPPLVADDRR